MKCPICGGTGETKNIIGKHEQTNEEWLRSCTTEQLVEWLQEHMDCVSCGCKTLCRQGHDCKLALMEWLKQPHREENDK